MNFNIQVSTNTRPFPQPGVITFHVYAETTQNVRFAEVFWQPASDYSWHPTQFPLVAGQWTTVNLTIPATAMPLNAYGIQIGVEPDFEGAFYIDEVGW